MRELLVDAVYVLKLARLRACLSFTNKTNTTANSNRVDTVATNTTRVNKQSERTNERTVRIVLRPIRQSERTNVSTLRTRQWRLRRREDELDSIERT